MGRLAGVVLALLQIQMAQAETLVAARTIRPNELISARDLELTDQTVPGTLSDPNMAIGQEARTALYAGRPIRPEDIGRPAVVNRNEIVSLVFVGDGLRISTEARSLGRGGIGDRIRVMNLSSRASVFGKIQPDGSVVVSQ